MVSRKCSRVHDAATSIEATLFFCQVSMVCTVTTFQVDKHVRESATLVEDTVLLGKL